MRGPLASGHGQTRLPQRTGTTGELDGDELRPQGRYLLSAEVRRLGPHILRTTLALLSGSYQPARFCSGNQRL